MSLLNFVGGIECLGSRAFGDVSARPLLVFAGIACQTSVGDDKKFSVEHVSKPSSLNPKPYAPM